MFLFLMLMLVPISPRCPIAFSFANAGAFACSQVWTRRFSLSVVDLIYLSS